MKKININNDLIAVFIYISILSTLLMLAFLIKGVFFNNNSQEQQENNTIKYTIEDREKLKEYLENKTNLTFEEFKYLDINKDGILNSGDLLLIQKIILKGGKYEC